MFKIFQKKILYFPGSLTNFVLPNIMENYIKILKKLKVNFFMLPQVTCCGSVVLTNGYTEDFENLRDTNLRIFEENNVKNIITNSGQSLRTLALNYKIRTQHITQILVKYLDKFPVKYEEEISIYDSPSLKVYEEPRQILESIGFDVVDLKNNRENTIICGAEGGMIQNVPYIANKLASNVFKLCKTKNLIVCDPLAYYHLKKNAPREIKVLELSEVLI